jgi:hypothetical protein
VFKGRVASAVVRARREALSVLVVLAVLSGFLAVVSAPAPAIAAANLICTTNSVYALSTTAGLSQVDVRTATPAPVGGWTLAPAALGVQYNANALAVTMDGTRAYAVERSISSNVLTGTSETVLNVLVYDAPSGAFTKVPVNLNIGGLGITGGAYDPKTGLFVFGGVSNDGTHKKYELLTYNPATRTVKRIGYLSLDEIPSTAQVNGDISFDASGNFYIAMTYGTAAPYTQKMYTVDDAAFQTAASGGAATTAIPGKQLSSATSTALYNGFAYDGDGAAMLGTSTGIDIYDPNTWQKISSSPAKLTNSGDLASCARPPSLTVRKNVAGRLAPADQFALAITQGSQNLAAAATDGSATGMQTRQAGTIIVRPGQVYGFSESMAAGSASALADYDVAYTCTYTNLFTGATSAFSGTTAAGTITAKADNAAECTFTNTPPAAQLRVTKTWVVDGTRYANGNQPAGLSAQLRLTVDGATSDQAWGTDRAGLRNAQRIGIDETTTISASLPGCRLDSARVTSANGAATSAAVPYTHALGRGQNAIEVTNTVTCTTSLTLVKRVLGGASPASAWTLSAYPLSPATASATVSGTTGVKGVIPAGTDLQLAESGGSSLYVQDDSRTATQRSAAPRATGSWDCSALDAAGKRVPGVIPDPGTDGTVQAPAGASVECVAVNRTAQLSVLKFVDNSVGSGSATPADWRLTATPGAGVAGLAASTVTGDTRVTAANSVQVRPGHQYTLTEAGPSGYEQRALERFTGADPAAPGALDDPANWTAATAAVSVAADGKAVYRFVNAPIAPKPATLVVDKVWVVDGTSYPHGSQPAGLGATLKIAKGTASASAQDWGVARTGFTTSASDDATIDETTSISAKMPGCTLTSARVTSVNGVKVDQALAYTHRFVAGENRLVVTNTVTCTTTLTLQKNVANGPAKPTEWTLSAYPDAPADAAAAVSGATGVSGAVTADRRLQLAEAGGSPLYVQDDRRTDAQRLGAPRATGSWTCTAYGATGTPLTGVLADGAGSDGTVTPPLGSRVTCVAVNRTAQLSILKFVDNGEAGDGRVGTAGPSDWDLTVTPRDGVAGLGSASVGGDDSVTAANTLYVRPGHPYTLDEVGGPGGYLRKAVQRFIGDDPADRAALANDANWVNVDGAAPVQVAPGGRPVYRFVNEAAVVPPLPLTGGPGGVIPAAGLPLLPAALFLVLTLLVSAASRRGRSLPFRTIRTTDRGEH